MKKSTNIKTYQSKQHPDAFITVDLDTYDERAKTYIADYPDGKSIVINNITLTRWWQEVDPSVAVSNKVEVSADNINTDNTIEQHINPNAVPVPKKERKTKGEVSDREKKAIKRAKAKSKAAIVDIDTRTAFRQSLTDALVAKGFEPFEYAMKDVLLFRINGKTVIRIQFTRKDVKFLVRSSIVGASETYKSYNYFLDALIQKTYSNDTITDVLNLLNCYV